jgi:hypothetical protein
MQFHSWSGSKFDVDGDLWLELLADAEQVAGNLVSPGKRAGQSLGS